MEITVVIEDELSAQLVAAAQAAGVEVNQLVKSLVHEALKPKGPSGPVDPKPYVQREYVLGLRPDFDWDKALTIAGRLEDESVVRKMASAQ